MKVLIAFIEINFVANLLLRIKKCNFYPSYVVHLRKLKHLVSEHVT
jgi:hypothetical protein